MKMFQTSQRNKGRVRVGWLLFGALLTFASAGSWTAADAKPRQASHEVTKRKDSQGFSRFVAELWPFAEAKGVSRSTFDAAFKGVAFDARIVAHTKNQAEFAKPIWQYLASAVSPSRIDRGQIKAAAERVWLEKAQSTYGVSESVIMGIWGMETEYGAFEGSDNVIRALASLAYVHYRGDYFRDELIAALAILEEGDVTPRLMLGSWAGAMGQTQFMPSSFNEYAVDFDGDGRRDIWQDSADAIGSTANYLAKHGWTPGLAWGYEVILPEGFTLRAEDSSTLSSFASFAERGVKRADGEALPRRGDVKLMIPSSLKGPIFLVTNNFNVIKSYNNSTSYALGVALLGDAIAGHGGLRVAWPTHERQLTEAQVREMQSHLRKLGYNVGEIDGRAGETLRAVVRSYQEKLGAAPDGNPSFALLKQIKDHR